MGMKKKIVEVVNKVCGYTKDGKEIPDPVPVAAPVGFKKPLTIQQMIAKHVRIISAAAKETGQFETPEEADDFNIPGEYEEAPKSGFEVNDGEDIDQGTMVPEKPVEKSPPVDGSDNSDAAGSAAAEPAKPAPEDKG